MSDTVLTAMSAQEAWDRLQEHTKAYYAMYSAVYSGGPREMRQTARPRSFWKRPSKQKIHVPIAADIAATSSDLLFGEEMQIYVNDDKEERIDECQLRMETITTKNNFHALLCEAAESASALGDVYFKVCWDRERQDYPIIRLVQGDDAWPEYRLGVPFAIHIFTDVKQGNLEGMKTTVFRTHECYMKGRIETQLYRGTTDSLGTQLDDWELEQLGIEPVIEVPVDAMLAIHIPNIRPNRMFRGSFMGRSDFDNQRDLMDALDEAYSSWVRDIRLGKARLLVPAEYLRRNVSEMFDTDRQIPTFEFDEDVETLCALDVNTDHASGITPSQFSIRSHDHQVTCIDIMTRIVTGAGYAPQTFGIGVEGIAQSGTALRIREKKSYSTTGKKQAYWQDALEELLTSMVHLDSRLYPGKGSREDVHVHVRFSDVITGDLPTTAQSLQLLTAAQAASTEVKVKLLHPDWTSAQVDNEVKMIQDEYGLNLGEISKETMQTDLDTKKLSYEMAQKQSEVQKIQLDLQKEQLEKYGLNTPDAENEQANNQ